MKTYQVTFIRSTLETIVVEAADEATAIDFVQEKGWSLMSCFFSNAENALKVANYGSPELITETRPEFVSLIEFEAPEVKNA